MQFCWKSYVAAHYIHWPGRFFNVKILKLHIDVFSGERLSFGASTIFCGYFFFFFFLGGGGGWGCGGLFLGVKVHSWNTFWGMLNSSIIYACYFIIYIYIYLFFL